MSDEAELDESKWWLYVTQGFARDPSTWLASAERLHASAEHLWNSFESHSRRHRFELADWQDDWGDLPATLMLAGFALENLAKGLIIAKEPNVVRDTHLERWSTRSGHEIPDLLNRAAITLVDDSERLVVARLEYFARWAGRYPVPMKFAENTPIDSLGHGYRPTEISDEKRAAEWEAYRRVYTRAHDMLAALPASE
jgi:hypothetical protein